MRNVAEARVEEGQSGSAHTAGKPEFEALSWTSPKTTTWPSCALFLCWQLRLLQAALKQSLLLTRWKSKNSPLPVWVLICVWKGSHGKAGLRGWSRASLRPHTESSASCFMLAVCSLLFPVSLFEAPIKQNRLIKQERVSEAGSCAYSNRLPSLDVYTQGNKKQKMTMLITGYSGPPFWSQWGQPGFGRGRCFAPVVTLNWATKLKHSEKAERSCHHHVTHHIYICEVGMFLLWLTWPALCQPLR